MPNVFLIDITPDEIDGVRAFFQHQPGVSQPLDLLAGVQGRFVSLNGKTLDELKEQHFPRRMLESAEFSWADAPPAGDKVTQGKWWTDANVAEIAIGEGTAQRLHLGVGSSVEIAIGGRVHALKVAALYKSDGQHLAARISFMLPSGQLKDEQSTWYGGAHVDPKQVAAMERALFSAYPTVTVINIADVLDRIESVVDQITFVVRFLAALDSRGSDDSCFEHRQRTLSPDARSRRSENAGSDAYAHRAHVQCRVQRTRAVSRVGWRGICQYSYASATAQA